MLPTGSFFRKLFPALIVSCLILVCEDVLAQCTNNNVFWLNLTPGGPGLTATSACTYAGEYNTVNVQNGQTYIFSTCGGATYDTQLTLYSNAGVFLAFNDDFCGLQSQITWTATFTGVVRILLDQFFCASNSICATMNVTWFAPVPNNLCSGAIPVACGQTIIGSTASQTAEVVPACGAGQGSPSLWYRFTGTGQTVIASLCGSAYDTYITVYSGTCAALSCVVFNDDFCGLQSQASFATIPGVNYFIMVSGYNSFSGSFTLNISCFIPQPNDPCSGALPISCGSTLSGNSLGALLDAVPLCGGGTDAGLWYSVTGTNQTYTASLCGSAYNTFISIYSGSCSSLTCSSFNDNFCGTQSQVTWFAAQGVNYFIHVHTGAAAGGAFTLNLSCANIVPGSAPPGCPDIELGPDIIIPTCAVPCQTLTLGSSVFQTGLTTAYTVTSIPPAPPFPYNSGTGFSIGIDDVWTGAIDLPFSFCFFGNVYSRCLVGSNGVVSFNITDPVPTLVNDGPAGFCPWTFTTSAPSNLLPVNAIFGVYHDIDPEVCGDARYTIFGTSPCRAMVISFDDVCHYASCGGCTPCTTMRSTHMIVMYETTNVIEVYVENKPSCTPWNSGNALLGIQNSAGTVAFVPPGRNTGPWTANNEAWRFTPSGGSNVTVNWFQGGTPIGTGTAVNVCVNQPTTSFEAQAIYTNCNGTQVTVTDNVVVACSMMAVPVEWLGFEAENAGETVLCTWQTATELNSDFFTVERSTDLSDWTDLGSVPGAGTTLVPQSYQYTDLYPLVGVSYYRTRQTDTDGSVGYSEVRAVSRGWDAEAMVFPNPSVGAFGLSVGWTSHEPMVWDAVGREIPVFRIGDGSYSLGNAAPGTYFIRLMDRRGHLTSPVRLVVVDSAAGGE